MKNKNNDFVIENISDAFLALNELDEDVDISKMIRSKPLKSVREGRVYSVNASKDSLQEAQDFINEKNADTTIEVIDVDADSVDHIKDKADYIGQAILCCEKCKANRFIDMDKLVENPENPDVYNVEEECPHCKSAGQGFTLIGQVGKVADEKPEETSEESQPEIENDESTDEITFDNDLGDEEKSDEENKEEASDESKDDNSDKEDESAEDDNDVFDFDEDEEDNVPDDETDSNEDEDNDIPDLEDVKKEKKKKELEDEKNESKENMYCQDIINEAFAENEWGKKAWMLGQIIQCMNDEEAYYNGWLYYWPDGETEEDCMSDFGDEESYEELEDIFVDTYKRYHEGGLFEAPEEVEEAAHDWDDKLGLSYIDNDKRTLGSLHEDKEDEFEFEEEDDDEYEVLLIDDLLDTLTDVEAVKEFNVSKESGDELYNGTLEDFPEDLGEEEFVAFNVGEGHLVLDVDPENDDDVDTVEDFLQFFNDDKNSHISIVDSESSEELGSGTKAEMIEKFGGCALTAMEAPERLNIIVADQNKENDDGDDDDVTTVNLDDVDECLNEASYGGAYDILDDQYFTRDDLNDFGYDLADRLNNLYKNVSLEDITIDKNVLHIAIDYRGNTLENDTFIDMRKIRKPSDLNKYLNDIEDDLSAKIESCEADLFESENNNKPYNTQSLFEDICKVNHLATYRVKNPKSREYWINECLTDGDASDIEKVYDLYVRGRSSLLERNYKLTTGYREVLTEEINGKSVAFDQLCGKAKKHSANRPDKKADDGNVVKCESFKTRSELSKAINECKNNNRPYSVAKSSKPGYRYDLVINESVGKKKLHEDENPFENELADAFVAEMNKWVEKKTAEAEQEKSVEPQVECVDKNKKQSLTEDTPLHGHELVNAIVNSVNHIAEIIQNVLREKTGKTYTIRSIARDVYTDVAVPAGICSLNVVTNDTAKNALERASNGFELPYMDDFNEYECTDEDERKLNAILKQLNRDFADESRIRAVANNPMFIRDLLAGRLPYEEESDETDNAAEEASVETGTQAGAEVVEELTEAFKVKNVIVDKHTDNSANDGKTQVNIMIEGEETNDDEPECAECPKENNTNPCEQVAVEDTCKKFLRLDIDNFDKEICDYFKSCNESWTDYHTNTAKKNPNGKIILEGVAKINNADRTIKFRLSPMKLLHEGLDKDEVDVQQALGIADYKVTNDYNEDVVEYKFTNDTPNAEIEDNHDIIPEEVIKDFEKDTTMVYTPEMIDILAEWEYVRNKDKYDAIGWTESHIKNALLTNG